MDAQEQISWPKLYIGTLKTRSIESENASEYMDLLSYSLRQLKQLHVIQLTQRVLMAVPELSLTGSLSKGVPKPIFCS